MQFHGRQFYCAQLLAASCLLRSFGLLYPKAKVNWRAPTPLLASASDQSTRHGVLESRPRIVQPQSRAHRWHLTRPDLWEKRRKATAYYAYPKKGPNKPDRAAKGDTARDLK